MTNLEVNPVVSPCRSAAGTAHTAGDAGAAVELVQPREVPLGGLRGMRVRRVLPSRALPTVWAAWPMKRWLSIAARRLPSVAAWLDSTYGTVEAGGEDLAELARKALRG